MDWSKLDPNVVTILSGVTIGVLGWLWRLVHGDKVESARDILDSVVTQVLNTPGLNLDNVKQKIEAAARPALAKLGIKGSLADNLIHEFVEYGAGVLHERMDLFEKELQKRLDDLAAKAQDVSKAFDTKPIVPPMTPPWGEVEVVAPAAVDPQPTKTQDAPNG